VDELNVQNQQRLEWPNKLVVAKAYLDQLARSQALSQKQIGDLQKAIKSAEKSHLKGKNATKLSAMADSLRSGTKTPVDAARVEALAEILKHPVA
jgi:hypothetical protein